MQFISNIIEERQYFSEVMKRRLNKELLMTKEDNEFLNVHLTLLNVGSVTMIMLIMMLK